MSKKKKPDCGDDPPGLSSSEIPAQESTEANADYESQPASVRIGKIHPRQPVPPMPEGEDVADDTPSPPTKID